MGKRSVLEARDQTPAGPLASASAWAGDVPRLGLRFLTCNIGRPASQGCPEGHLSQSMEGS